MPPAAGSPGRDGGALGGRRGTVKSAHPLCCYWRGVTELRHLNPWRVAEAGGCVGVMQAWEHPVSRQLLVSPPAGDVNTGSTR